MIVEDVGCVPLNSKIHSGVQSFWGRCKRCAEGLGQLVRQKQMNDNFGLPRNILFISAVIRSVKAKKLTVSVLLQKSFRNFC